MSTILETIGESAEATHVTVTYGNGAQVAFPAKASGKRAVKRMHKDSFKAEDGTLHTVLYFRDGQFVDFTIDPDVTLADRDGLTLLEALALHGAEQKLGDNLAGSGDSEIDELVYDSGLLKDQLLGGKWASEREGGPSGESILFKALLAYRTDKYRHESEETRVAKVKAFLAERTPNEKRQLRDGESDIKPYVDALRAPPKDVSSLIASFT